MSNLARNNGLIVAGLFLATCLCGGRLLLVTAAESERAPESTTTASSSASAATDRLREGTTLSDQVGYFKLTGDRLTFYTADGAQRLGGLENLNLERIAKILGESAEPLEWSISGTVTEFQGTNYLLISRAVLKTKVNRRSQPAKS